MKRPGSNTRPTEVVPAAAGGVFSRCGICDYLVLMRVTGPQKGKLTVPDLLPVSVPVQR